MFPFGCFGTSDMVSLKHHIYHIVCDEVMKMSRIQSGFYPPHLKTGFCRHCGDEKPKSQLFKSDYYDCLILSDVCNKCEASIRDDIRSGKLGRRYK